LTRPGDGKLPSALSSSKIIIIIIIINNISLQLMDSCHQLRPWLAPTKLDQTKRWPRNLQLFATTTTTVFLKDHHHYHYQHPTHAIQWLYSFLLYHRQYRQDSGTSCRSTRTAMQAPTKLDQTRHRQTDERIADEEFQHRLGQQQRHDNIDRMRLETRRAPPTSERRQRASMDGLRLFGWTVTFCRHWTFLATTVILKDGFW
jgi:hypothetical protein